MRQMSRWRLYAFGRSGVVDFSGGFGIVEKPQQRLVSNSVLLKPAEQSPLSELWFAELAAKVGVAVGVFNVVTGFGATARKALGLHMDIDFLYRINRDRQAAHAISGAIDPEIGLARNERQKPQRRFWTILRIWKPIPTWRLWYFL